jgi:hypothetical protein
MLNSADRVPPPPEAARTDPAEPEVYRFQVDIIVLAASREDAEKAIRVRGPHLIRSVTYTTIRDKHGTHPSWRITQEGDQITVLPKRRRKEEFDGRRV